MILDTFHDSERNGRMRWKGACPSFASRGTLILLGLSQPEKLECPISSTLFGIVEKHSYPASEVAGALERNS